MMETKDIDKYIQIGLRDKDWYQECEALFKEHFGQERLKLVAQLFAATSQASSLKSNIQLFRKALNQWEKGLPFVGYLPGIQRQLTNLRSGNELSGLKIRAFANAMSGDINAVVVDRWLLRAFNMDKMSLRTTGPHKGKMLSSGATKKQFKLIEDWVRVKAEEMGIEPRQLSAIIWSGVRISISGDKETHYKTILKHKLYNMYEDIRTFNT
jgi:hypothetical protein